MISERLGDSIDQEERTYFGLFSESDHFLSATAYHHTDTTVFFLITERRDATVTETELVVSNQTVAELRHYIDDFEKQYETTFTVRWPLLQPVARRVRHLQPGLPITVVTADDEIRTGWLFYVNEQGIVLSKDQTFPERSLDPTKLLFLPPYEIKHIRDRLSLPKRFVKEINIPEAGEEGFYLNRVVALLKKRAAFSLAPSPEMRVFIKTALAQQTPPDGRSGPYQYDEGYRNRMSNKVHLAFSFHPYIFHRQLGYSVETVSQGVRNRPIRFSQVFPTFRMEYRLARRIRLGVGLHAFSNKPEVFPEGTIDRTTGINVVNSLGQVELSGFVVDPRISYAFKAFDEFSFLREYPLSFYSSIEARLGVGPSLAYFSVEAGLSSAYTQTGDTYTVFSEAYKSKQTRLGGTAFLEIDLYISRYFSIGIGIQAFWFPKVRIDPLELLPPGASSRAVKTVREVEHTLLYWDPTIGIRFHL